MSVAWQCFPFSAFAYVNRQYPSRTFYNHVRRLSNFFRSNLWAVYVDIIFLSSRGCSWERVTIWTRFYRPKRPPIFNLINIFCCLECSLHPFSPDFDAVVDSLLLADSTLTNNLIRKIWVIEAEYCCAFIWLWWFAIGNFAVVQAPVELTNISIFPRLSRDGVS